jgi:hypothetical protein
MVARQKVPRERCAWMQVRRHKRLDQRPSATTFAMTAHFTTAAACKGAHQAIWVQDPEHIASDEPGHVLNGQADERGRRLCWAPGVDASLLGRLWLMFRNAREQTPVSHALCLSFEVCR